jgi:hypothetical protein
MRIIVDLKSIFDVHYITCNTLSQCITRVCNTNIHTCVTYANIFIPLLHTHLPGLGFTAEGAGFDR